MFTSRQITTQTNVKTLLIKHLIGNKIFQVIKSITATKWDDCQVTIKTFSIKVIVFTDNQLKSVEYKSFY